MGPLCDETIDRRLGLPLVPAEPSAGPRPAFLVSHDGKKAWRLDEVAALRVLPKLPSFGHRHLITAERRGGGLMNVSFHTEEAEAVAELQRLTVLVAEAIARQAAPPADEPVILPIGPRPQQPA